MTDVSNQFVYRRRGTDHLGFLGAKLRDLLGYGTLAQELIQNADDAVGTSSMWFDVREDDLVVDNDGAFTDCHSLESRECPWKATLGRMCDFHRFQNVASGDKRQEENTTGAFGIGFTAVYQITDQPQVISAGRHWLLFDDRPEDERIAECQGCTTCQANDRPNTRFILPWAFDPNSPLRLSLKVDPATHATPPALLAELLRAIPLSMLFLKKLTRITLSQDGKEVRVFERLPEGDSLIVSESDGNASIWHLLRTSYDDRARQLREQHPGRIEAKRSAEVTLAIPQEPIEEGYFCACLPTHQGTGLPLHLNADFFPKSDRKGILLDGDFQSEWNRAAIEAAAAALAERLEWIRDKVEPAQLWRIIHATEAVSKEVEHGRRDRSLSRFWGHLATTLRSQAVVFTSRNDWARPDQSLFLEREEEEESLAILESLGLNIVHRDLRFAQNVLRSKAVGVPLLNTAALALAIQGVGLTKRTAAPELPASLRSDYAMRVLWRQIDRLAEQGQRSEPTKREAADRELAKCAVAPVRDGTFWPCGQVYQADDRTIELFQAILSAVPFLASAAEPAEAVRRLCPIFDAAAAIRELIQLGDEAIRDAVREGHIDVPKVLRWFENQRGEISACPELKASLRELPIFPSATGPRPLCELSLPGGFEDPLRLADVVDTTLLGGRYEFLRDLDAAELTLETYALQHVPRALQDEEFSPDRRRQVVRLLAERLGRLRDRADIRLALATVPIVECED